MRLLAYGSREVRDLINSFFNIMVYYNPKWNCHKNWLHDYPRTKKALLVNVSQNGLINQYDYHKI